MSGGDYARALNLSLADEVRAERDAALRDLAHARATIAAVRALCDNARDGWVVISAVDLRRVLDGGDK